MSTHPLLVDDDDVNDILASGVFVQSQADLSAFRNSKGEFKRWLQVFYLEQVRQGRVPYFRVTHVLPWLCADDKVDPEYHLAAAALGAYANYPLAWRSVTWKWTPQERSPYWCMFTPNVSRDALNHRIAVVTGKSVVTGIPWRNTDFWKSLEHHVLVPRADGILIPHV